MSRRRASLLSRGPEAEILSPRLRFRRALVLVGLSSIAPGSAQVAVGRRWVGWTGLTLWGALLVGLAVVAFRYRADRAGLIGLATDSDVLQLVRVGSVVVTVVWLGFLLDALRLARPFRLPPLRAGLVLLVNAALLLGVAGTAVYASQVVGVQREVVTEVFSEEEVVQPLEGRYNILLIGSDAGDDRTGIRPDSLTVVSVDAERGNPVLVSLPRNLQNVPFREESPMHQVYPFGYNCGSECLINAVHTAAADRPDLYPGAEDPGLEATIDAVEGATDLTIAYYVMIDLRGFRSLVDAVGGVEMDVKTRLAKFGQADAYKQVYIEPGLQRLDGDDALWYARSRVQSDDYTRMGRQKCLLTAMLDQLSPRTVLLNASEIGQSSRELLATNIPASELGAFGDLALRARDQKIASVSLVPPEVNVVFPDYDVIHEKIKDAIRASMGEPTQGPSLDAEPEEPTTPQETAPGVDAPPNDEDTQSAANNAEDLGATC